MLNTFILILITFLVIPFGSTWLTSLLADHVKWLMVNTLGTYSQVVVGGLGVIVHELAHMLTAIIFRHRITHFKLLTLRNLAQSYTLGDVYHEWDQSSWYQNLGNFFIGIAPFYFCSGVLGLISRGLGNYYRSPQIQWSRDLNDNLRLVWQGMKSSLMNLFTGNGLHDLIFLVLIIMIASTGYSLSHADIVNTLHGMRYWTIAVVGLGILFLLFGWQTTVVWTVLKLDLVLTERAFAFIIIVWAFLEVIQWLRSFL